MSTMVQSEFRVRIDDGLCQRCGRCAQQCGWGVYTFDERPIPDHSACRACLRLKLYNVRRSAWHTHTLSEDATVLIVENRDTALANSPEVPLEPTQRAQVVRLAQTLWEAEASTC